MTESVVLLEIVPTEDGNRLARGITRVGVDGTLTRLHTSAEPIRHGLALSRGTHVEGLFHPREGWTLLRIASDGTVESVQGSHALGNASVLPLGPLMHSPDAAATAFVGAVGAPLLETQVFIVEKGKRRQLAAPRPGRAIQGISWSGNGKMLAYYFAETVLDTDFGIARWGCATTNVLEDQVKVLSKPRQVPSQTRAWERPPIWSTDSRSVYFSGATERKEGQERFFDFQVSDLGQDPWVAPSGPVFGDCASCYRANVKTGKVEFVSLGTICAMAPDGEYILLGCCPEEELETRKDGRRVRKQKTWKVDLATGARTVLPDAIKWPKISPTGKYVVTYLLPGFRGIAFYRTSDWSLVRAVPGVPIQHYHWVDGVHWIRTPVAQPGKAETARLTSEPATTPSGRQTTGGEDNDSWSGL